MRVDDAVNHIFQGHRLGIGFLRLFPRSVGAFAVIFSGGIAARAQPVSFKTEIAPLLHRRCAACHGEESAKGGYRLDSFARLKKSGDSELPPLVLGKSGESELYSLLVEPDANDRMPQKADALPAEEIAMIRRWIDEGAALDAGSAETPLAEFARATLLRPAPEKYAHPAPVTALAFSPDSTQLAVAGFYEITVWEVASGALVRRIGGLPERITSIAWNAKRNLLAVAGGSPAQWGTVALIDPAAGFKVQLLCDLPETALSVAFSPDGARLAAGGGDRTIRFFETKSGRPTRVLRQHAEWVQSVAFSADGEHLVSASRDRTVRVFNAATGGLEATDTEHEAGVLAATFSLRGTKVFSAERKKAVRLAEADLEKSKSIEIGALVQTLALSPAGLVTGGADGSVRVHQVSDHQQLFTLAGHRDCIDALAVSRSGTLASGSHDGVVCVWDLACGTWTQRFTPSPGWDAPLR